MSKYTVDGSDLTSIANAIRTKGETSASLSFPNEFVSAIGNIPTGGGAILTTKNITANGTYDATDDNADGYSSVTVNVPQSTTPFSKVGTFTVVESWEYNQSGITMCQAALDGYLSSNSIVYLLVFNNNTITSSYRADAIICVSTATTVSGLSSAMGVIWRDYYASPVNGLGSSCKASAGTVIDIYRADHGTS